MKAMRRKAERGSAALGFFALVPLLLMASTPVQKDRSSVRPSTPTELGTAAGAGATGEPDIAPAAQKAGADASWWQTVSARIERDEYRASVTSTGLQAPNRAQDLRTYFRSGGIDVVPRQEKSADAASWRLAWRTTGFGRAGQMHVIASTPSEPTVDGARVCYARGGIDEWYENKKEGLEQGFTVHERPSGKGALRLEGRVDSALHAQLKDGAVDFIDAHGVRVLRYADVHAVDARGRALTARLQLAGERLAIVIDDGGASYPITVDPLMTSPSWIVGGNQASAHFGWSVGTAGDVNGDGYSDVIVGAPSYDNGQTDEGRAYVYLGSSSGLAMNPAWTAESDQAGAAFGRAVGSAADVNGDGYSDVIIGAPLWGPTDKGRAFVYLGSSSGLAASPAWTADGPQGSTASFGTAVGSAGDVNGDGYADVIVGAPNQIGQLGLGQASMFLGSSSGLALSPAWTADGDQADALFGASAGTAGDVNGDGYADVIVGAPYYDNGPGDEGRAYVYLGSSSGLAGAPSWTAGGVQSLGLFGFRATTAGDVNGDGYSDVIVGARFGNAFLYLGSSAGLAASAAWTAAGWSVRTAGDVNGDGYSDVIVGDPDYTNGESQEGRSSVYLGSPAGLAASPVWTVESNQAGAAFGYSAATAGDVNGDGYSDVIVGAENYHFMFTGEGGAFVYLGSASGLAPGAAWSAESNQPGAFFGQSVASAGDVNGDGYSDVIVGVPYFDNGPLTDEGAAFVYPGSAAGLATAPAWTGEGNQSNAHFGISVASAGDVNGDGFSDVIVGAEGYTNEGRALVYLGSTAGLALSPAWTAEGNDQNASLGHSVGTAGDVNGDGYSDVIVGVPYNLDLSGTLRGKALVYHGSASGLGASPAWTVQGDQPGSGFGISVGTAGDVNGDGFSDVIVGDYQATNGESQEGRAFVYHGSLSGLSPAPNWTAESNQAHSAFGCSVGTAGDVNGDGFSDVIVGASAYPNVNNTGRAFVYHGSSSGLGLAPAWQATAGGNGVAFGSSVGTAGDVNGDGYSDVIVGDPRAQNIGWALMFLGSPTGLQTSSWISVGGGSAGAAVATAGDVNGDGYSDVIVGAPAYSNGQTSEGRAYVYYGNGGDGLDRAPRQARSDNSALISLLGRSDSPSAFGLRALGRTAAGRGKVHLQWEVKPFGTSFNGSGVLSGSVLDTGVPGAGGSVVPLTGLASGLSPQTVYHWRLRTVSDSPFFPHSPWLSPSGNAPSEADLRTAGAITGMGELASNAPTHLWLEPAAPNPFATATRLSYSLPTRGPVHLTVYDVTGREVAKLTQGVQDAGRHTETWDGRGNDQTKLAAGVYFARLEFGGRLEARKIVLVK